MFNICSQEQGYQISKLKLFIQKSKFLKKVTKKMLFKDLIHFQSNSFLIQIIRYITLKVLLINKKYTMSGALT